MTDDATDPRKGLDKLREREGGRKNAVSVKFTDGEIDRLDWLMKELGHTKRATMIREAVVVYAALVARMKS